MTTTTHEFQSPWLFAQFTDGKLELLQLDRLPDDPDSHAAVTAGLRESLGQALGAHRAAQNESLTATFGIPPANRDHRVALEFAADELARARSLRPGAGATWFPTQADGRDTSGRVHVSVTAQGLAILEVPPGLTDRAEAAAAIVEAFNLAVERLDGDTVVHLERNRLTEPEKTDWAALAEQAERIATGQSWRKVR